MFLLDTAFRRTDPSLPPSARSGLALAAVGHSMTAAAAAEVAAFALGGLATMPAVRAFALYTAVAILADYILQACGCAATVALCPEAASAVPPVSWHRFLAFDVLHIATRT